MCVCLTKSRAFGLYKRTSESVPNGLASMILHIRINLLLLAFTDLLKVGKQ